MAIFEPKSIKTTVATKHQMIKKSLAEILFYHHFLKRERSRFGRSGWDTHIQKHTGSAIPLSKVYE